MALIGSRDDIVWEKTSFWGTGGLVDADHCFGPFRLIPTDFYHIIGEYPNAGRAVLALPLKKDWKFGLRSVVGICCLLPGIIAAMCVLIALMFLMTGAVERKRSIVSLVASVAVLVACCIGLFLARDTGKKRRRDIRLVIGRHQWGCSDPVTWPDDIADRVRNADEFQAKSFSQLSRRFAKKRQWPQAMFAARLCAALEDQEEGEALSDEVLEDPDVADALDKIRSDPSRRPKYFKSEINLKEWIEGEPRRLIMKVYVYSVPT